MKILKSELLLNKAAMRKYISELYGDNSEFIKDFKIAFFKAMRESLTKKQYDALIEHYVYGKKQKEIAKEWNVSPAVICRHIKKARSKLNMLLSYNLYYQHNYNPDSVD